MTTEEFTRGELVEVRDHNSNSWNKRIFLTEIHWSEYPFICVDVNKVNEFKVNEAGEPIILNPFPERDKVEYYRAGEGSRRWGA